MRIDGPGEWHGVVSERTDVLINGLDLALSHSPPQNFLRLTFLGGSHNVEFQQSGLIDQWDFVPGSNPVSESISSNAVESVFIGVAERPFEWHLRQLDDGSRIISSDAQPRVLLQRNAPATIGYRRPSDSDPGVWQWESRQSNEPSLNLIRTRPLADDREFWGFADLSVYPLFQDALGLVPQFARD